MRRRPYTIMIYSCRTTRFRVLHLSPQKLQATLLLGILTGVAIALLVLQNVTRQFKHSQLQHLRRTVQAQESVLTAKLEGLAQVLGGMRPLDKGIRRGAGRPVMAASKVTIPQGFTLRQIAGMLAAEGLVDRGRFLELAMDPSVARSYVPEAKTLEGFLFPDTYYFAKGQGEEVIIEAMVHRFYQAFSSEDNLRADQRGRSLYEIVTLASIVEKEALVDREKPIIAGIFFNRLKRGMRLQADPTVLYGRHRRGRIRARDLRAKHPYNTYIHHGLPPGPIASPGAAALKAALHPDPVEYLYFVSKNNGTHYFSRTLQEHNRAVRKYQLRRNPRHTRTAG